MKVAIMGAGLAGLACAHELERHGIVYDLYERNDFIGEAFNHVSAILSILHRPVKNYLDIFEHSFGIKINILNPVKRIVHIAPNKKSVISGNHGQFLKRGRDHDSVKNQLFNQLKNPNVLLNTNADYDTLKDHYDYVVAATGNVNLSKEKGCFQTWLSAIIHVSVVHGTFDPTEMTAFVNRDYCKNGYAYLTPFDSHTASLVQIVPDIHEKEMDYFFEKFIYTENLTYDIIESYRLQHVSGYGYPGTVDNLFLTGNALGIIDPFLGFGQISSISTGVYAARSIALGIDYHEQFKDIHTKNIQLHEFRKAFDGLSNSQLNLLMMSLKLPVVKQILYDSPLNVVPFISFLLKNKKS